VLIAKLEGISRPALTPVLEDVDDYCNGFVAMTNAMSALKARRQEIANTIERLKAEDKELASAEAVVERLAAGAAKTSGVAPRARAARALSKGSSRSQRTLVIQLLSSCDPPWLGSGEIVKEVRSRYGVEIPERSLRPLLSVMKRERLIARAGRQVALSERI
jgi:hypothetical protein